MGSLGWKKFDFFDSSVVHAGTARKSGGESRPAHHGWNSSEGERLCCAEHLSDTSDGYFWVGSTTGMVYKMHMEGSVEYEIDTAFPALEDEGTRVVYLKHMRFSDEDLLVAVGMNDGRDGDPQMEFLCWEVANFAVVPKEMVSSRVFRSVKVPEGRITCVDIVCDGWPHVYITVGTSSGGVYVYSCADVGKKKGMAFQMPFGHHMIKGGHAVVDVHMVWKSSNEIYVYGVSGSGVIGIDVLTGRVLMEDDVQAQPGCSDVNQLGELVMCNSDGIFFYTIHDGRTVAASIKGEKEKMVCFGDYVLVCFTGDESVVKVLHVQRKIAACSIQLDSPVQVLFRERKDDRECLLVMDGEETMYRVMERSPESQVDALCNSRCFSQALRMCEGHGEALQAEANRRYGDYMFDKRDFEAATEAYIRTIGFLETSYPIQKLLNAQQIHHLCTYVRALFDRKAASGDHISLLIQSYAKAKATLEIDSFVAELCAVHHEYTFDTDAAIGVLRDTGLVQHALDIAQAYNKDETYVSILLNERKGFKEVLDYLRSKPREFAAKELAHHGKVLLQKEPVDTTALLMELCLPPEGDSKDAFVADLASFSQLYIDNPQDLRYACEAILAMGTLDLPSKKSLYHTLFDIYLSSDRCEADMDVAMDLLKRGWVPGHEPEYDADVVLTSCRLHGFHQGLIFINLMLHRYREAIAVMAEVHDWNGIVQTCQKHGDASQGGDQMVWHDALVRMASPAAGPGGEEALKTLLELVEENAILPPLTVLNVLSKNPHLKLGLVKQYFVNLFEAEYECIKDYEKEIEQIRKSTESQERILHQLENEPAVFQSTKDSQTGAPLELPLVHFMCGHSFNLRTLGDQEDPECPLCSEDHKRIQDMTRSFRTASQDKDSFFRQLRAADDGFRFVAEAFGKGYLNHSDASFNPMQ